MVFQWKVFPACLQGEHKRNNNSTAMRFRMPHISRASVDIDDTVGGKNDKNEAQGVQQITTTDQVILYAQQIDCNIIKRLLIH